MVEEGAPDYIERDLNTILRRRDIRREYRGKDVLPMGGEYTAPVLTKGVREFLAVHARELLGNDPPHPDPSPVLADPRVKALAEVVPPRPPGFCIGCPERPIFAAMKLVEQELGQHHISADIGCHLFSILPPFNVGATTMGYGLGPASASAFNVKSDQALDLGSRRWRFLAQRPRLLDRQRGLQQARRRHADRRQLLLRGDRRAGHSVISRA